MFTTSMSIGEWNTVAYVYRPRSDAIRCSNLETYAEMARQTGDGPKGNTTVPGQPQVARSKLVRGLSTLEGFAEMIAGQSGSEHTV